jgi:hypothetical protein
VGPGAGEFAYCNGTRLAPVVRVAEGESVGSGDPAAVRTNGLGSAAFAGSEAARLFPILSGEHSRYAATIAAIKGKPKVFDNSRKVVVRSGRCLGRDRVAITSGFPRSSATRLTADSGTLV